MLLCWIILYRRRHLVGKHLEKHIQTLGANPLLTMKYVLLHQKIFKTLVNECNIKQYRVIEDKNLIILEV